MLRRTSRLYLALALAVSLWFGQPHWSDACCAVTSLGKQVVNADQSVIIIWDPSAKKQHFIRQASFKASEGNVGFIVPSPTEPELEEAGDEAFTSLAELTAPEVLRKSRGGGGCGCSAPPPVKSVALGEAVQVLQQKRVGGFDAVVLAADSAEALNDWLKENGYSYSPAVAEWAKPYVEEKWKFTAMKVAKEDPPADKTSETDAALKSELEKDLTANAPTSDSASVAASAIRISFTTDQPLFPYREPASTEAAAKLNAPPRTLRIFFLSDARYEGKFLDSPAKPWSGTVAWADKISDVRRLDLLRQLKLTDDPAPGKWWLTEFSDNWQYEPAPGDVYFSPAAEQAIKHRPPIYVSQRESNTGGVMLTLALACALPWLLRRRKPSQPCSAQH